MKASRTRIATLLAATLGLGAGSGFAQEAGVTGPHPSNGNSTATVNLPTTLPGTPQTTPAIPNPRAFATVVKDAVALPGLFPLYQKEEKVFIELSPEQMGKPYYLSINRTRGLGEGFIFPFMMRGYLVEFRRVGGLVQMIAKNAQFAAAEGTPLAKAARESFTDSLLAAAPVVSEPHPERKSFLVDASGLFLNDIAGTASELESAYRAQYSFDQRNSSFTRVRATGDMSTFEVSAHFAVPKLPAPASGPNGGPRAAYPQTLEDPRSMFLGYHYSLAKLPAEPMRARAADGRIGHFVTRHYEFTNDSAPFPRQYFVNRWRLEKKDPAAALSEPKHPIVYWLDRNIPVEYRETVKAGVLEWNKAFEKIGFKDAIRVEMQPDDADFDTADLRHASIRWYLDTADGALAIGPRRVDPRTGEILDADIAVSQGWTRLPRRLAGEQFPKPMGKSAHGELAQCAYGDEAVSEAAFASGLLEARGELDPNGPEAQAIIKATLKDVITHEVGHTLGLRHNFRASTIYTEAQIADPEFTRMHGIAGSVMDYNAWNIALAKEKQGEYVMSTLGPYDYWAIEYAYKEIAPAEERSELSRIAARSNEPQLAYATDEETGTGVEAADPEVNQRDLGADPLAFARRRMALSRELWDRWQARKLPEGESRDVLYRNTVSGFNQYLLASQVAAKYVGGVIYLRDHAGSPRASFTPIAPERQREALKLVTEGLFRVDSFGFQPEFLARLAADPLDSNGERSFSLPARVLNVQAQVLDRLMSDGVATRLLDSTFQVPATEKSLTLSDLYDTLQASIWSDLKGNSDIPVMRRNLQREHVRRVTLALTQGGAAPADARALLRLNARSLVARLKAAEGRKGLSKEARAHLAESRNTLEEALKAPMHRMGA
jgi:hypothetical protein